MAFTEHELKLKSAYHKLRARLRSTEEEEKETTLFLEREFLKQTGIGEEIDKIKKILDNAKKEITKATEETINEWLKNRAAKALPTYLEQKAGEWTGKYDPATIKRILKQRKEQYREQLINSDKIKYREEIAKFKAEAERAAKEIEKIKEPLNKWNDIRIARINFRIAQRLLKEIQHQPGIFARMIGIGKDKLDEDDIVKTGVELHRQLKLLGKEADQEMKTIDRLRKRVIYDAENVEKQETSYWTTLTEVLGAIIKNLETLTAELYAFGANTNRLTQMTEKLQKIKETELKERMNNVYKGFAGSLAAIKEEEKELMDLLHETVYLLQDKDLLKPKK